MLFVMGVAPPLVVNTIAVGFVGGALCLAYGMLPRCLAWPGPSLSLTRGLSG